MKEEKRTCKGPFIDRLKEATGCETLAELSHFFDVPPATAADWLSHERLPFHQQSLLRLRGINPEWVATGIGAKHCAPAVHGEEFATVRLNCPLKKDLKRMLKACNQCSAWATLMRTVYESEDGVNEQ